MKMKKIDKNLFIITEGPSPLFWVKMWIWENHWFWSDELIFVKKLYWIFKWLKRDIQEETRKMVSFKHLELITQSKSMFVTTYLALEFNPSCTTDFSASVQ